ncbi:PREDICTED: peroxidase 60 [Tarenaya hassleriana]|uniref:peroxidase 60 n=1 Tax=Tarenaya hassleriana TaxID=28532 RepID=UPI00053C1340|nr:PREDICTED: peroxidase 60 [Tarenaya hassleriana]
MAANFPAVSVLIFCLAFVSVERRYCFGQLLPKFYNVTCPSVENVVFRVVNDTFHKNATVAPALIRLYFHDCFSGGCDASLLLDGPNSEKKASPNLSVRGYDLIDAIKTELEKVCRGIVSCADVIALATRDLVTLASGGRTRYEIPTGRFDSRDPSAVDLPSPAMSVSDTVAKFATRGLNLTDMVLLLGGHTIGVTHCSFVLDRIYNFRNTGRPDPLMDPQLVKDLKLVCPPNSKIDNAINLDQDISSANIFDVSFYKQIDLRRGILVIDQAIAVDGLTNKTVTEIANGNDFLPRFGEAMVKLGFFGVKGRLDGEIRKSCSSRNKPSLRFPSVP